MKAKPKTNGLNIRGKSGSAKIKAGPSKPTRAKRIRPLAPKQFVDIIEHMNDGLVVLDKDWHYIYVNQKAAAMLQRQKPSDLIGKHIWTEYPEGLGQPFHLAYEKAMKEQVPIVYEDHYEPWDLWFENRIYPSPDSLLILFTEITDRKRIERLLNERQYLLQKILDTEPGTVYIYDLEEQRNVYINRYWLLTYGYTEEETQAMGDQLLGRIIHPDDLAHVSTHHQNWQQEYALDSEVREIEYRVRTKTGEWRWLHSREVPFTRDARGRVKQILGITHDVTEHKQAEEEVQEQNRFISALAETTPGLVYVYDWQTGSNVYSNRGNEFLLGYTSEEVKNMGTKMFAQLLHPDDGAAIVASQQRLASASDQDILEIDYRLRHSNGEWRWLRSYERPFARSKDGSLKQKIGIAIDITERKRMELALAASEAELRALLASMNDVVLVIDRNGVYRKIAPTNPDLLYKPPEELLGKTLQDVFPVEQAETFIDTIRQVVETQQTTHIEYQLVIDDRVVWFDASVSPMGADSSLWMARDITDRKQAEEALRLSESNFRTLADKSLEGIQLYQGGRSVYANAAMTAILGYTAAELAAMSMEEHIALVHPLDRATGVERARGRQAGQDVPASVEIRVLTKSGATRWLQGFTNTIEYNGQPATLSTAIDITERKLADEALRESEAIYRRAIEAAGAVPYRQSYSGDGNLVDYDFIGEGIVPLTGYRPEEFNATLWDSLVRETHLLEDLADYSWDEAVRKVRSGDIPVWKCEYLIQARDGMMRWLLESGVELRDENGISHGSIGLFQDITERRWAEERLRELTRRLVAAQEEERKRIAQELHDELGQALTAISLDLGGIEKALPPESPPEIRRQLTDARSLADEVDERISELALDLRPSLLDDLGLLPTLQWYLKRYSQRLGIKVALDFKGLESRLPDEVETTLYRVIQEALTNIARHAQANKVLVNLERSAATVTARIQDDGRGFDLEDVQGSSALPGGLGLVGIEDRVSTLGGRVEIHSSSGQGTRIQIEIPL
jgi:PAS domain S-box-containing protein